MLSLKIRILAPLVICLLSLLVAVLFGFYRQNNAHIADDVSFVAKTAQTHFRMAVDLHAKRLAVQLGALQRNDNFIAALKSRHRDTMFRIAQPEFERLRSEHGITHFYFHDAERINLLRVHQPDRFGDTIERITLLGAERTGSLFSGVELGPFGTLTLRAVVPVYEAGRLLGYLELGEEINSLTQDLKRMTGIDSYVVIDKRYLSQPDWRQGMAMLSRSADWGQFSEVVLVSTTSGPPSETVRRVIASGAAGGPNSNSFVRSEGRVFSYWLSPIKDVAGREVGRFFQMHDVSDEVAATRAEMTTVGIVVVILGLLLSGLFYLILGRIERQLVSAQSKLVEEARQREATQIMHVENLKQEVEAHEKTEKILEATQASLKHLLIASPVVIYSWEPGGDYAATFVSDNVRNLLGFDACEFVDDPTFWFAHIHPDDKALVLSGLSDAFDKETHQHEYRFLVKQGTYRWIHDSMRLLRDSGGEPIEIVGCMSDITERKKADAEAMNLQQRLALHFQQTPLGIIEWNTKFEVSSWNPAAEKIFGYDAREAVGRPAIGFIVPQASEGQIKDVWDDLLRGESGLQRSNLNLTKGGVRIFCDWHNTTLVDAAGDVIGIVSQVEDVTERNHLEAVNLRVARALKTLSAGNMALVRADNIENLRQEICQILVDSGNYVVAWIGIVEDDPEKSIRVVTRAGEQSEYLDEAIIRWADDAYGRGPAGKAIRTGQTQINTNLHEDPDYALWREDAIRCGFQSKIALPLKSGDQVFGCLNICSAEPDVFDFDEVALLEEMTGDLSYGIRALGHEAERLEAQAALTRVLLETVGAIAMTVEKRDPYTAGHQTRVAQLATAIASKMDLGDEKIEGIRLGATIHDIGKIYIPAEILNRPGRLSEHEFGMIQSHPQVGFDIVAEVGFPWPIREMILQHHERIDGTGYPQGLKGDEIILEARIIAVADVVEAISSHRPYRASLGTDKGLAEIRSGAGAHYDREVVDTCIKLFEDGAFEWE